jgi:hypothetical protein
VARQSGSCASQKKNCGATINGLRRPKKQNSSAAIRVSLHPKENCGAAIDGLHLPKEQNSGTTIRVLRLPLPILQHGNQGIVSASSKFAQGLGIALNG